MAATRDAKCPCSCPPRYPRPCHLRTRPPPPLCCCPRPLFSRPRPTCPPPSRFCGCCRCCYPSPSSWRRRWRRSRSHPRPPLRCPS